MCNFWNYLPSNIILNPFGHTLSYNLIKINLHFKWGKLSLFLEDSSISWRTIPLIIYGSCPSMLFFVIICIKYPLCPFFLSSLPFTHWNWLANRLQTIVQEIYTKDAFFHTPSWSILFFNVFHFLRHCGTRKYKILFKF